jgi:hypothetical protein
MLETFPQYYTTDTEFLKDNQKLMENCFNVFFGNKPQSPHLCKKFNISNEDYNKWLSAQKPEYFTMYPDQDPTMQNNSTDSIKTQPLAQAMPIQ